LLLPQVVSTVATLSSNPAYLTSNGKRNLMDVGQAGLSSAQLSANTITPDSASRLLGVLAAGRGMSDAAPIVATATPTLQSAVSCKLTASIEVCCKLTHAMGGLRQAATTGQ
jgi:hypothetical protein